MVYIFKKFCLFFLFTNLFAPHLFCAEYLPLNYYHESNQVSGNNYGIRVYGAPGVSYRFNSNNDNHKIVVHVSPGDTKGFQSLPQEYSFLCQFELFAYQDFRSHARTLPCYEDFMIELQSKINSDKKFREETECVPGFKNSFSLWGKKKSEFHNFVQAEANRIKEQRIIQKQQAEAAKAKREDEAKAAELKRQQDNQPRICITDHAALERLRTRFTQNNVSQEQKKRNQQRGFALSRTLSRKGACYNYSSQVPPASPNDTYAPIFSNTYGTPLDCQLHQELCQTRSTMTQLEYDFPQSQHVQAIAPMVHHLAVKAKVEKAPDVAFEISDFCYELTQVVAKGVTILRDYSCAAGKRILNGTKTAISPGHWKEMAQGSLQLAMLFFNAVGQEDARQEALFTTAFSQNPTAHLELAQKFCVQSQAQQEAMKRWAQETCKKLSAMSWQELAGNALELGTTMILDTITLNAASGFAGATGRAVVSQLSKVMENGALFSERYAVEVAGFGKLIIEEGSEVATEAIKDIARLSQEPIAQTIKNNLKAPIWTKLSVDELKKIGSKSLQNDIRAVQGTAKDAWEFFKTQVENFKEIKPGVFVGTDTNKTIFTYRAVSKFGPPTIDVNGIKGLRKIKFINESLEL